MGPNWMVIFSEYELGTFLLLKNDNELNVNSRFQATEEIEYKTAANLQTHLQAQWKNESLNRKKVRVLFFNVVFFCCCNFFLVYNHDYQLCKIIHKLREFFVVAYFRFIFVFSLCNLHCLFIYLQLCVCLCWAVPTL